MRHIDDGALHAYLDGAHDLIGAPGGVDALVAHLAECGACRARLEAERAVHERADAILALGAPRTTELPPFAALEGRGGRVDAGAGATVDGEDPADPGTAPRPTRRAGPRRRMPLAWAATVVLALGAGWIAREMMETPGGERMSAVTTLEPQSAPESEPPSSVQEAENVEARSSADEAPVSPAAPSPWMEAAPAPGSTEPSRQPRTGGLAAGLAVDEAAAAERERERRERQRAATAEPVDAARYGQAAAAPPPAPPPPPPQAPVRHRAAQDIAVTGAAAETEPLWRAVDRRAAEDALGRTILIVPGLPVIAIEEPAAGPTTTIRLRQRLQSGEVLTLQQSLAEPAARRGGEAAAAPARAAESEPFVARSAVRQDVVEVEAREEPDGSRIELREGDLVVHARAPIPLERLRELLGRLR